MATYILLSAENNNSFIKTIHVAALRTLAAGAVPQLRRYAAAI